MTTGPEYDRIRIRRNANAAKLVKPALHWGEGMLLAPQHFQSATMRGETLPYYHAAAISPFHWGVMDFEMELSDGLLTVRRVEAVMPDGLVVRYPDAATLAAGDRDLAINLAEHAKEFADGKSHMLVYLAVASRDAGPRFSERYDHVATDLVPEDVSGDELQVEILKPRLKLVLRPDSLESVYTGFPIAKVGLVNGAYVAYAFIPPSLRVAQRSTLHGLCTEVRTRLRETASGLARRIEGQSASTHGAQLLERRMIINALVTALPPLEVILESGAAHPFTLYLALASVLGSVSTGRVPPDLPSYDHDDVLPRFNVALRAIDRIIDESVQERYTSWAFQFERDAFRLKLKTAWIGREMVLGVRIPRGRTREDVDAWIMGATIGSSSRIEDLYQRRTLGAKRIYVTEHELIPMSGVVFYRLSQPFAPTDIVGSAGEELVISNEGEEESNRPDEILLYVRHEPREPRERIPQVEV
ncbi:MAG TPA: type VI secretion system baseplate subunit TssK [Thermoanaerobaculia bacterium]|nr:type VI secretion system baseplate subunit TssK [Thermoanaerobaculia bacterium]